MNNFNRGVLLSVLAISVYFGGCKRAEIDAGKKEGKPAAVEQSVAARPLANSEMPVIGAAEYGAEICKTLIKNSSALGSMYSAKYMALSAMTAAQQKAKPKGEIDAMLKEMEDTSDSLKNARPLKISKLQGCKVLDARDVSCDEVYLRIDAEGSMGTKLAAGRAKDVGDNLKVDNCGLIKISTAGSGTEQRAEWGVGRVDGKQSIIAGFEVKSD